MSQHVITSFFLHFLLQTCLIRPVICLWFIGNSNKCLHTFAIAVIFSLPFCRAVLLHFNWGKSFSKMKLDREGHIMAKCKHQRQDNYVCNQKQWSSAKQNKTSPEQRQEGSECFILSTFATLFCDSDVQLCAVESMLFHCSYSHKCKYMCSYPPFHFM